MEEKILNRKTFLILGLICLAEMFSFFGFLLPSFSRWAFFVILFFSLAVSFLKLEYGLYLAFAELFIGSKGYLFSLEAGDLVVSLRIALWLIVIAVWLGRFISRRFFRPAQERGKESLNFFYPFFFAAIFIFIAWGFLNGLLRGQEFYLVFFDFNGWLYFALAFPLFYLIAKDRKILKDLGRIFYAALIWLGLKTFLLLFIFSHNLSFMPEVYRWVRLSGVGEITEMPSGFVRIFFQSHIFSLAGFFLSFILLSDARQNTPLPCAEDGRRGIIFRRNFFLLFLSSFSLAAVLISFSRSLWIGLAAGLAALFFYWLKHDRQEIAKKIGWLFLSSVAALTIATLIISFPYPRPSVRLSFSGLISERAQEVSDEAAAASRWSLLPALWGEVRKNLVLGQGFGATVTYYSHDPRVLETENKGKYTTYAFEWGWLDVWLKLGFFGLVAYIFLMGKIFLDSWRLSAVPENKFKPFLLSAAIILLVLAAVNFFSPFVNHPLGIGLLLLTAALAGSARRKN